MILEDGTIQSQNDEGKIQSVDFKRTRLGLSGMRAKSIIQAKVQETSSMTLVKCMLNTSNKEELLNCPSEEKIEVLAEINRRFGMPLYVPFVALLCSFLLINREENKFGGFYKYLYSGIAFVTLVMAEILVRYSGLSYYYSLVYYIFPLIFITLLYLEIIRKFKFENLKG